LEVLEAAQVQGVLLLLQEPVQALALEGWIAWQEELIHILNR
jgi:hypothetical protein